MDWGNSVTSRKGGYLRGQSNHRNVGRNDKASIRLFRQTFDDEFDVGVAVNRKINRLNGKVRRNGLKPAQIESANGIIRVVDHANAGDVRSHLLQSPNGFLVEGSSSGVHHCGLEVAAGD